MCLDLAEQTYSDDQQLSREYIKSKSRHPKTSTKEASAGIVQNLWYCVCVRYSGMNGLVVAQAVIGASLVKSCEDRNNAGSVHRQCCVSAHNAEV
jgi:hypothetical protein